MTHHGSDSGEATTFPHIVFSTFSRSTYIRMQFFPGIPKEESQNCLGLDFRNFGSSYFVAQTSDWDEVWSKLVVLFKKNSNGVLHSTYTHRGRVDSRLLVVRSQIANLTSDLSFVHNLCCRCSNGSCEAIFDIYTSRPFQRCKKHLKTRCFDPYNRTLNF
jgi:hypothetical protein